MIRYIRKKNQRKEEKKNADEPIEMNEKKEEDEK